MQIFILEYNNNNNNNIHGFKRYSAFFNILKLNFHDFIQKKKENI
jgi:hypothetical protein